MQFVLTFGLMWLVVAAIYTVLFSVGTGLQQPQEQVKETKKEAEVEATAAHDIPHAA